MLSRWNTPRVDLCSMWHNYRLFQVSSPWAQSGQRGKNALPQLACPRSGGRLPQEHRGQEKGPGTLLSQAWTVWKLLQPVASSCPSPLTQNFPKEVALWLKQGNLKILKPQPCWRWGVGRGSSGPGTDYNPGENQVDLYSVSMEQLARQLSNLC